MNIQGLLDSIQNKNYFDMFYKKFHKKKPASILGKNEVAASLVKANEASICSKNF